MKSKEELLSEETRAAADASSRFLQWGVTLMISVQTALFFVRHEIVGNLIDAGKLSKGSGLPFERYIIGTAFLVFLAFVLSLLTARSMEQYRNYKNQLIAARESGIQDLKIRHMGRWAYYLYFSFPAIDILVRIVDFSFNIKFE
jgi:hypothetical protein